MLTAWDTSHRNFCTVTGKSMGDKFKGSSQAAGQTALKSHLRIDRRLKGQVFPNMRAKNVWLEAKGDLFICAFGARYLKSYRTKYFVHVTSRKMRELAKILIELRSLGKPITTMFSALRPQYSDYLVEAAKRIGKYDLEKNVYLSPTFAMNIVLYTPTNKH